MKKLAILFFCLIFASLLRAETRVFVISPGGQQNVTFYSKATIESFKGVTDQISGSITVDPENLLEAVAVCSVDMKTLDTGIKLRNQHMNENHLHTSTYPQSIFRLRMIDGAEKLLENNVVYFKALGGFTLHGIEHRLEVNVSVTYYPEATHTPIAVPNEAVLVRGTFKVNLSDYEIPMPKFLFMKLAETQEVEFSFWAVKEGVNEDQ